jgi:acyl-coenzyme A synthetase/AMP-(fatty) acid ligase
MSNERRRATSFDLILFRIPKTSGSTGNPKPHVFDLLFKCVTEPSD